MPSTHYSGGEETLMLYAAGATEVIFCGRSRREFRPTPQFSIL